MLVPHVTTLAHKWLEPGIGCETPMVLNLVKTYYLCVAKLPEVNISPNRNTLCLQTKETRPFLGSVETPVS